MMRTSYLVGLNMIDSKVVRPVCFLYNLILNDDL